jgi:hypothetical protein
MTLASAGAAAAQLRGAYLPLDHPAHRVAELLVARGVLSGLDGANRPFPLADLRTAVTGAREGGSRSESDLRRLEWLSEVIGSAPPDGDWLFSLAPEVGALYATSDVPELFLAEGDSAVHSLIRVRAGAEFGPASVQVEPRRVHNGRAAYGAALARAAWRYGGVEWGDLERNWGPPGVTGLLWSPLERTRPELSFFLGPRVLRFEYRTAPLSSGVDTDTRESAARVWAMHRLRWRPSDDFEVAVWETTLSAEPGGPDVARLSPLRPFSLPFQQGRDDGRNTIVGLDASWRMPGAVLVEGQFAMDDYYRDESVYPQRYGWTLQARGPLGMSGASWRAYGTALASWALMTFREEEYYVDNGQGLGRLRPDHREAGIFGTLAWGLEAPAVDTRAGWPGGGTAEVGVRWRRQGPAAFSDPPRAFDLDRPDRYPTFSPEIEREVWALVADLSWLAGPFALQTESHLQYRRFPEAGEGWGWGFESTVELVWRIGRWSWDGTD